jgi:hypothetical protein
MQKGSSAMGEAIKHDTGKQEWYALPLCLLKPLADVMHYGEQKYHTFNCLHGLPDSDRRLWNATMRHLEACQLEPLAIDRESNCYHAAHAAFSILMRLYQRQLLDNSGDVDLKLNYSDGQHKEASREKDKA